MNKPTQRRKRAPRYIGKNFYLPIPLAKEIEDQAEQTFGGNQSALVTEVLMGGRRADAPPFAGSCGRL